MIAAFAAVFLQSAANARLAQRQLFVQLYSQWETSDLHRKRAQLARSLLRDPSQTTLDDTVLVFFETLGYMYRKRMIDRGCVWTSFSFEVCSYYLATSHFITAARQDTGNDSLYEELLGTNSIVVRCTLSSYTHPPSPERRLRSPRLQDRLETYRNTLKQHP